MNHLSIIATPALSRGKQSSFLLALDCRVAALLAMTAMLEAAE
jgi:hypothetical protein